MSNPFREIYLEALKGGQHKIDVDKDGKIEDEDLAKLRAKKMKEELVSEKAKEKEEEDEMEDEEDDEEEEDEMEDEEEEKVKKEATEVPFSGPYTKSSATITDKSGAKHTAMSRAKHLAQMAAKKKEDETKKEVKEDVEEGYIPPVKPKLTPSDSKTINKVAALMAKEKAAKAAKMKEEVEQIDELDKSTLGSYVKKASTNARINSMISKDFDHKAMTARKPSTRDAYYGLSSKYKQKSWKRSDNVAKAVDRLTKEEVELEEVEELDEDKYDRMLSSMLKGKSGERLLKKHSDEVKKTKDIESGKTLNKLIKKNPGVLKTHSAAVKRDKKIYGEEVKEIEEKSDQAKQNKTMKNLMAASKGAQINRGLKLNPAEYGYKRAQNLNVAIGRAAMKAEETQMEFTQEELQLIEQFIEIAEKMNMSKASMGDVIKDFKKSDAPQFAGKSMEKRRQMAIAAKLSADRGTKKEEVELVSFKGFNLDEIKMSDLPSRKVTGKYGTEYYKKEKEKDERGYDADDDKESSTEKRGRGRPKGSSSGARQKGSTPKKKGSGVEMTGYPLHLPGK
jgi:hypothetical protein